MTRNTIAYKQLEETKRSNIANERIKIDQLVETIRNNNLTFMLGKEKNEISHNANLIQKLANDQLNSREKSKLEETIRHNIRSEDETIRSNIAKENETYRNNLATLDARLQELEETKRNNIRKIQTERRGQNINKAIKDEENRINSERVAVEREKNAITKAHNEALESLESKANDIKSTANSVNQTNGVLNFFSGILGAGLSAAGRIVGGAVSAIGRNKGVESFGDYFNGVIVTPGLKQMEKAGIFKYPTDRSPIASTKSTRSKRERKEENEVPEDYTNSWGPGGKNENSSKQIKKNETGRNGYFQSGKEDGGSNYALSKSSGSRTSIIYSPGAKKDKEVGPGIGLAFS